MQKLARCALALFLVTTAGVAASLLTVWHSSVMSLDSVVELGPHTNPYSLVVSMGLLWCLIGTVLLYLSVCKVASDTAVMLACITGVSLLYLTFLREHVSFGDYPAYIEAANAIRAGEPFPEDYVYPPLWASFLAKVQMSFGESASIHVCFALNHLSIVGFFVLGSRFLSMCGISRTLSYLLLSVAMIVNVPILRNVVYVQVNLLLLDLILASVLVYRRSSFLSALLLALATHLKVIPVLFVPLFLSKTNYRWPIYYGLACIVLAGATVLLDGGSYYFDFLQNLGQWQPSKLRSCSIYGFLVSTNRHLHVELPVDVIFNSVRTLAVLWLYALSYISVRRCAFSRSGDSPTDRAVNGLVPLLFLMTVVPPTVWVYHLVILIIPAVLIFVRLRGRRGLLLWCVGYSLTFLLPVFDWYPWSYLRLVGWIALLVSLSDCVLSSNTSRWLGVLDRVVCTGFSRAEHEMTAVFKEVVADRRIESDR